MRKASLSLEDREAIFARLEGLIDIWSPNMRKVKLVTADGGFVAEITIPETTKPYDAIVWGSRTFFHRPDKAEYFEGCVWHSLPVESQAPAAKPAESAD